MNKMIIRDVLEEDISSIKAMIDETWDWASLVENKDVLNAAIGLYLNQVLYNSSFGKVAVLDNKIVGTIFGWAEGEIPKYRMLQEDGTELALLMLNAKENERKDVYECMSKLNAAYDKLLSGKEETYDGTLVFFVVSEDTRGYGVGKTLWNELGVYFREKNVDSIYVYTDTDCNYGFYEHSGFERKGERDLTCCFQEGEWKVKVFLYDYQIKT